jgi:hypothetical protein
MISNPTGEDTPGGPQLCYDHLVQVPSTLTVSNRTWLERCNDRGIFLLVSASYYSLPLQSRVECMTLYMKWFLSESSPIYLQERI